MGKLGHCELGQNLKVDITVRLYQTKPEFINFTSILLGTLEDGDKAPIQRGYRS